MIMKNLNKQTLQNFFNGFIDNNEYGFYIDEYDEPCVRIGRGTRYISDIYNHITNEIHSTISIEHSLCSEINTFNNLENIRFLRFNHNQILNKISGFNKLEHINKNILIQRNRQLKLITGFENLNKSSHSIIINANPKLITLSIPITIFKSLVTINTNHYIISYDFNSFTTPEQLINSPLVIKDLVTKFNPGDHCDLVVKQIIENLEEWGTEETKEKVYSFLLSHDINNDLFNQEYLNRFDSDTIKSNNDIIRSVLC